MKADCRAKAGDEWAQRFYRSALRQGREDQQLPGDLPTTSPRGTRARRDRDAPRDDERVAFATRCGLRDRKSAAERFQQALDISAGRKQPFVQEPTVFYFPELPRNSVLRSRRARVGPADRGRHRRRSEDELLGLLRSQHGGFPAVHRATVRTGRRDTVMGELVDNPGWSVLFLCENGNVSDELVTSCPRTWEIVQRAPLATVRAGVLPDVLVVAGRDADCAPYRHAEHPPRLPPPAHLATRMRLSSRE